MISESSLTIAVLVPVIRKECRIPDSLICCPKGAEKTAPTPRRERKSCFIIIGETRHTIEVGPSLISPNPHQFQLEQSRNPEGSHCSFPKNQYSSRKGHALHQTSGNGSRHQNIQPLPNPQPLRRPGFVGWGRIHLARALGAILLGHPYGRPRLYLHVDRLCILVRPLPLPALHGPATLPRQVQ